MARELPTDCGIRHAARLKGVLLAVAQDDEVVLDGSAVERCDAAGLQLLIALQRELAARQAPLTLRNPSAALRTAIAVHGLEQILVIDGRSAA